jgi:hypothetical protein
LYPDFVVVLMSLIIVKRAWVHRSLKHEANSHHSASASIPFCYFCYNLLSGTIKKWASWIENIISEVKWPDLKFIFTFTIWETLEKLHILFSLFYLNK